MKFILGFVTGAVVGAAGAIAYSMQTGRDLREVVEEVRSEVSKRDLDALGARLESRVGEMQVQLEARITQVREKAMAAVEEARSGGVDAAEDVVAETSPAPDAAAADEAGGKAPKEPAEG